MDCQRHKAKPPGKLVAPLPRSMVKENLKVFCRVAIGFAAPFLKVHGRGKPDKKQHLCLIPCSLSRAVHLGVAFLMDSDLFLNAFCRMINRRGLLQEVISDNGRIFVGVNKELRELVMKPDN